MLVNTKKLLEGGCNAEKKNKVCRARGGESCAFDGAMIVLQPIADTAHIVHGPIACAGNSWEGRGSLSSKGNLHRMGFTTDMGETDIIYGSEEKLYKAIIQTYESVKPKAIFVYATCVSGLIGEDIEAVCKRAELSLRAEGEAISELTGIAASAASPPLRNDRLKIRVIPVNAPGFAGPKNLGNRIAGEVLLEHVIGTGKPPHTTPYDINLIGEYNIAGDQWLIEPIFKDAGIRILSRITGDAAFEEITYAHHAKLNVVVCSRALINIATEMERRYGIPYVEVSFFGKTEIAKALRAIAEKIEGSRDCHCEEAIGPTWQSHARRLTETVKSLIQKEEQKLADELKEYAHLKGKKAVLYTGGVKSWSLISALRDLGIDIVAVGTKKSTFEDEEKIKELMGENAPLVEDVAAKNLLRLMRQGQADMLIAGGRNQYLAMKEGYPFVDVNQERHVAYAGYKGLVNLAREISNSIEFFSRQESGVTPSLSSQAPSQHVFINPLKHSPAIGAAIAFQGVHNALPIIHGAQGCAFLGKVLLTKHFREPIALASTKLFVEEVVMGSDNALANAAQNFIEKNNPDVVGILSSGLSEVKGDDIAGIIKTFKASSLKSTKVVHIPTSDYIGGLETGYARAVEEILSLADGSLFTIDDESSLEGQVNILVGSHLTPADFIELREIVESFGLRPIILPDLSALDGSRQGFSALAVGGTRLDEIKTMRLSKFTIAIGASMEPAAKILKDKFNVEHQVLDSISGLKDTDALMGLLSELSRQPIPSKHERQRRVLIDGMRDAHYYYGGKKICLALEPDLSIQTSRWLYEMGANVEMATRDLFSIDGSYDLLIANSHGEDTAKRLGIPLFQMGFPVYKVLGNNSRITVGYRGTLATINEMANILNGTRGRSQRWAQ